MVKQKIKKLAKTWTEQEPGVDLAVYFVVHKKFLIAKIAKTKCFRISKQTC